ncbi:putative reverse transcriptase domain-containing protein [Tanacetum coccineum]
MPSLPSPEPAISCFDDLDLFKDFDNEFPAIVYNDAQTSKSDLLTEPVLNPQHIDEFDLNDKTSLSEYDEEEQNVLYFNDLFPFNIIHPNDLKSEKDNDDNEIDIIQSSGVIMEYLVNISKRRAFWSLNKDILKINYSDTQYAVSIKEDTAYPCLHSPNTTKETSSIRLESESQNQDKDGNRNGGGNGNSNGGGNGNGNGGGNGNHGNNNGNGNHNRMNRGAGGAAPVARACTYKDFLNCQPRNFSEAEKVVGLARWFEKMEFVYRISNYPLSSQVKFATCTLRDGALTWWNSHMQTIGIDEACEMSWTDLMKLMIEVYYLRNEIQKLENELWNLSVKGTDVAGYI